MSDFDIDGLISSLQALKAQGSTPSSAPAAPASPAPAPSAPQAPALDYAALAEAIAAKLAPQAQPPTPHPSPQTHFGAQVFGPRPNISDKGPAAPSDSRDPESILRSRPLELNEHDVERLFAEHGHAKAYAQIRDHIRAHLKQVRLVPEARRGRR